MSYEVERFLPVENPVIVFLIMFLVILFIPSLFEKIKVPGIIGLILAGAAIGPNGIHLLNRDEGIVLFGTAGLLFIMFLAGLEIDTKEFKKNSRKSALFGMFTFAMPMILGTVTGLYVLGLSILPSILLASMFASHTLLAYPEVVRLGIQKSRIVNITIGGTIITDLAALIVLAVVIGISKGELGTLFWLKMALGIIIFAFIVLWVIPKGGRWLLQNYFKDTNSKFIFILTVLFVSALLAEIAGLEPIIGAFLAGISVNKLVSRDFSVTKKIHFVGNTLFIPVFLISVGMLIDFKVLFQGTHALLIAFFMILVASFSKWFAAYIFQKVYDFGANERNLMFGLSNAQAAATLAAVMVGYNLGLFHENVLNGTIMMILFTCIISSYVTYKAGRKLKFHQSQSVPGLYGAFYQPFVQKIDGSKSFEMKNGGFLINFSEGLKFNNKTLVSKLLQFKAVKIVISDLEYINYLFFSFVAGGKLVFSMIQGLFFLMKGWAVKYFCSWRVVFEGFLNSVTGLKKMHLFKNLHLNNHKNDKLEHDYQSVFYCINEFPVYGGYDLVADQKHTDKVAINPFIENIEKHKPYLRSFQGGNDLNRLSVRFDKDCKAKAMHNKKGKPLGSLVINNESSGS